MSTKKSSRGGVVLGAVAAVLVISIVIGFLFDSDDSTAPGPTATEVADTVAVLAKAAEAQDICYGWRLHVGTTVVSVGSNLGDGLAVDEDPARCPRWANVIAQVVWTPESSELEDFATIRVVSTEKGVDLLADRLARFGLDEAAFIDEPGWATMRAAVVLPLLMAEADLAPPAPVSTASPTAAPPPLPDAGSDLWRDRWGYFVAAAVLLLVAGLFVLAGWRRRRSSIRMTRAALARQAKEQARKAEAGTG
jgi:hypothetical protein